MKQSLVHIQVKTLMEVRSLLMALDRQLECCLNAAGDPVYISIPTNFRMNDLG